MKIVKKKDNPLLQREEIEFEIETQKTPSLKELRKEIASKNGSKKELVAIRSVKQLYGAHKAVGYAKIYNSEEMFKKVELEYVIARNTGKKNVKKEEAAGKESSPVKEEKAKEKEKDVGKEDSKEEKKAGNEEKKDEKPKTDSDKKEEKKE